MIENTCKTWEAAATPSLFFSPRVHRRIAARVLRATALGALGLIATLLQPSPLAAAEIRIALVVDDDAAEIAAGFAVAEINANGPLPGGPVRLAIERGACDLPQAIEAARRLAASDVAAVIGYSCANVATAVAPIYAAADKLLLIAGPVHPRVLSPRAGPTVFRLPAAGPAQGAVAIAALGREAATLKVAIVHDRTQQMRAFAEAARLALAAAGQTPDLVDTFAGSDKDYSALIGRVEAAGASALVLGAFPVEAALILAEVRARGLSLRIVGSDVLASDDFARRAGSMAADVIVVAQPDRWPGPRAAALATALAGRRTQPAANAEGAAATAVASERAAFMTAAALDVWSAAARTAGTTDARAVAAALAGGTFATLLGAVGFTAAGDSTLPAFADHRWHNGKLTGAALARP